MVSSLRLLFSEVICGYPGVVAWKLYLVGFSMLLLCFLSLRCPYIYGMMGFPLIVLFFVFPLYFGELLSSISCGVLKFFAGFVPPGTPFLVAPMVCFAETVSFFFRPFVLVLRPIMNLSIGVVGGGYVALGCLKYSWWVLLCLVLLFFYEMAILVIHSFILGYLIEVWCKWK